MLRPRFLFTVRKSVRAVLAASGSRDPEPALTDAYPSQPLSIPSHLSSVDLPFPANSSPARLPSPSPLHCVSQRLSQAACTEQRGAGDPCFEASQLIVRRPYAVESASNGGPAGARAAPGAAAPEVAAAEAEKCDGGETSWQRGPWDREGFSGEAGRAPGGRGRGRGRGGRGGRGGMGWQALERALRENEKDEILPQGRDISAAAAAAGGVAESNGRREAQRERDSTLVSVIFNMLRSIQPPPPTAPTGPTGARVMAVQRKGREGRMGVDEMVALLQQQWQNWLARSSSSSNVRRRHTTRRSRISKSWDEEGMVIGNTHWDEESTGSGSSHRAGPFQAVQKPQGRGVTAYHVSEVLKALWDADAGLALFRWAKDVQGVKPDAHVYSSLFGLLGRLKNSEGLEGLEEEMREDGCGENGITLQALAAAYSRAGRYEEALVTLAEIQQKDDSLSPFSFGYVEGSLRTFPALPLPPCWTILRLFSIVLPFNGRCHDYLWGTSETCSSSPPRPPLP
ncbi:unnamed protein product [Closterium sp. NIES-53]